MIPGPLVLAPLRLEAAALRRGSRTVEIERIGMGPARATAARLRLEQRVPQGRAIVLAGVAGGLAQDLVPGEIVVATEIGPFDRAEATPLAGAEHLAEHLAARGLAIRLGPVVSSPKILTGAEARAAAGARGAAVVEMEGLWLAPLVQRHPFSVVRVVLDTGTAELASASTPRSVLAAYRALREVARALEGYAPAEVNDSPTRST